MDKGRHAFQRPKSPLDGVIAVGGQQPTFLLFLASGDFCSLKRPAEFSGSRFGGWQGKRGGWADAQQRGITQPAAEDAPENRVCPCQRMVGKKRTPSRRHFFQSLRKNPQATIYFPETGTVSGFEYYTRDRRRRQWQFSTRFFGLIQEFRITCPAEPSLRREGPRRCGCRRPAPPPARRRCGRRRSRESSGRWRGPGRPPGGRAP